MSTNVELFPTHTKAASLRAIHSASSNEWYTPPDVVDAAHELASGRGFDLDPASNALANQTVRARKHGGLQGDGSFVDGLALDWHGSIFLNPPGPDYVDVVDADGKPVIDKKTGKQKRERVEGTGTRVWWERLAREVRAARVRRCFYVAYSIEQLQASQSWAPGSSIFDLALFVCFPRTRVRFWKPDGKGGLEKGDQPTHASAYAWIDAGVTFDALAEHTLQKFGNVVRVIR